MNVADAVLLVQLLSSVTLMVWLPLQAVGTFKVHVSSPVSEIGIFVNTIWLSQWTAAERPAKPLPLINIDEPTVPDVGERVMLAACTGAGDDKNANKRMIISTETVDMPLICTNFCPSANLEPC